MNFGVFEGRTYGENLEAFGGVFQSWLNDPEAHPPPGGETMETFRGRVFSWVGEAVRGATPVVAVTHGGVIRSLFDCGLARPIVGPIGSELPFGAVLECRLVSHGLHDQPRPEPDRRGGTSLPSAPCRATPDRGGRTRSPPPPVTLREDAGGEAALLELLTAIEPPGAAVAEDVRRHLDALTKPRGSLGRLEAVALRLAEILGDPPPPLSRRAVFVLAGDHGVAARGVSAYPPEVTGQMCRNIADGGAAVSVLARVVGAEVVVADFGVRDAVDHPHVLDLNVRRGARDIAVEGAMTRDEATEAILRGAALVRERRLAVDLIGLGEMGIGNTTPASCLCAALTGTPPDDVVGPGTGVVGERREAKRRLVSATVERLPPDADAFSVLCAVGGLEIAGLVGVVLGAARVGLPVVSDGFIATAAALVATRMCPSAGGYLFAAHRSPEPGHETLLKALRLRPLLDLELRLGEGTGAVLAFPILSAAGAILAEMATFAGAGVSGEDGP